MIGNKSIEDDIIVERNIPDQKKENENLIANIIEELLFNLVECSPEQNKQNISIGSEDDFIPVSKGVKKSNFKHC